MSCWHWCIVSSTTVIASSPLCLLPELGVVAVCAGVVVAVVVAALHFAGVCAEAATVVVCLLLTTSVEGGGVPASLCRVGIRSVVAVGPTSV